MLIPLRMRAKAMSLFSVLSKYASSWMGENGPKADNNRIEETKRRVNMV